MSDDEKVEQEDAVDTAMAGVMWARWAAHRRTRGTDA